MVCAIDFSISNGQPLTQDSLHTIVQDKVGLIPGESKLGYFIFKKSPKKSDGPEEVNPIYSDEGLRLETSVFESSTVANLTCRPCG